MRKYPSMTRLVLLCSLCLLPLAARSADEKAEGAPKVEWVHGPAKADVGGNAEIMIPSGFIFTGKKGTVHLMQAMGNLTNDAEEGFLAPADVFEKGAKNPWFVVFEFNDMGYVKDEEKKSIDKDKILSGMKDGVNSGNEERVKRGLPKMELVGWAVEPHYDEATHNLEWGILLKTEKGGEVVNYDVRLLGRKGVMQCTLVLDPGQLDRTLPKFRSTLAQFAYKTGEKYAEYREGYKLAKIGLTALIGGGVAVAAWKLGFFKYFGKFILLIVVGFGAAFKKLWTRFFGRKEGLD